MEKSKAKERSLAFSDLVLQILDLGIREKVGTPEDIAVGFNSNGWDVAGVSNVWQVSLSVEYELA